ncbi:MAG TPA: GNAT family N-acetyltransferase [Gammaproteobacteria bacterium]|nr:GNAT family N-acetyltransferase [Gammaproteobacteria bacterium]
MTSHAFSIRPAVDEDRAQWESLWQGYLEFYRSSLTATVTDTLWRRILDPANEIQGRVAVAGSGELVGLVHFLPHAHTWYANPVCYLNDLYVNPKIRGGGIGRALIEAVIEHAKQQGWAEVYWHTQHHNAVARVLYDKITGGTDGFVNYCVDMSRYPQGDGP